MTTPVSTRMGGLLAKFVLVLAAGTLALATLFAISASLRRSRQCEARMADIHRALQLYEIERGALPNLAFYPDDPREGPDSLRGALENYGVEYDTCICPSEPKVLREAGQTFFWNATLSAQKMPRGATSVWMLVEASALSGDVPSPHWGGYHVLYSDGRVVKVRDPLHELPGL